MGTLILLRHGQSVWNQENLFTGWVDVELSPTGEKEAIESGALLASEGALPTVVHTSVLKRAIHTANIALDACDRLWVPVRRSWRLNERHYGMLQGLDKVATREKYGDEKLAAWRRSYDVPPPPMEPGSKWDNASEAKYAELSSDVVPSGECLADVVARILPYWYDAIVPDLRRNNVVLVVAHGNSLRALVKHLEHISDSDIAELNIPTGVPRRYELDDDLGVVSADYLGDADEIAAKAASVAAQASGK